MRGAVTRALLGSIPRRTSNSLLFMEVFSSTIPVTLHPRMKFVEFAVSRVLDSLVFKA